MKSLFISLIITVLSFNAFAAIPSENYTENEAAKLMEMVNNAEANDWETYSKAALISINWNADLELAKEWIDHAITVERNYKTLEVLGDYYLRAGNIEKAYATYEEALLDDITKIDTKSRGRLQRKLLVYSQALR